MRISIILLLHILFSACNNINNDAAITNSFNQKNNSSKDDGVKEQSVYDEFLIKISELSNIDSPKFSIVIYKNNEVSQNLNIPDDMDEYLSFDRRFFTVEDVNFDGYEDFYFMDYMGIVLKRRDNYPIVKEICDGIITRLLNDRNPKLAKKFVKKCLKDMFKGKYDIKYFLTSKTLKIELLQNCETVRRYLANFLNSGAIKNWIRKVHKCVNLVDLVKSFQTSI